MRIIFKERRSRLAHALNLRVDGSISYLQGILDKSRGLRLLLRPLLWYARHHIEFASSSWGKESCWSIFGNWRSSGLQKTPSSDRKSTRLNSSHLGISYAVFCLKKKKKHTPCHTHLLVRRRRAGRRQDESTS